MTVVFKLGGSLLTLHGLADKLRFVLSQRSGQRCLILPGGGAAADIVRDWSQIHSLSDETAHWLAISSLDLNRQLLQELLEWNSVSSRQMAQARWASDQSPLLLDLHAFAIAEESNGEQPLPHDWNFTSDSLAAWTSICWPADELILLKSIPAPQGMTADEASQRQFVDPYFPRLANQLHRIQWCNLRASTITIEPWL